jgi:hypothetical protein
MITAAGEFSTRRDIGQTCLRTLGVAAALVTLLSATTHGVAAADPAPNPVPPSGGGITPPPVGSGATSPPSGGGVSESPPSDDGDGGSENPPPSAGRLPGPPKGGHHTRVVPGHTPPQSTVSATSIVVHLNKSSSGVPSTPIDLPPVNFPPVTTSPTPAAQPASPPRPTPVEEASVHTLQSPAMPPAAKVDLSLKLSTSAISPGGWLTATGLGCRPATTVTLMVDQLPAGSTRTDERGGFQIPLSVGSVAAGRHDVTADCGEAKTTALNVVLVSRVGGDTATTTLILIFLISGVWYLSQRISSTNQTRN